MDFREYKTSSKHHLEIWNGAKRFLVLSDKVNIDDTVVIVRQNTKLLCFSLVGADLIHPDRYEWYADIIKSLVKTTVKGNVLIIGKLWYNRAPNTVQIANVTFGEYYNNKFVVYPQVFKELESPVLECGFLERLLTRLLQDINDERPCVNDALPLQRDV